ncbi:MAG: hypothetical protein ACYDCL_04935 [Myxococcales bacterium]
MALWELFRDGGFPMFGIVIFGLAALFSAARYIKRPRPHALHFTAGLGAATLFLTFAGLAADVRAVCHAVPRMVESGKIGAAEAPLVVLQGVGESMAPLIFGFTLLALTGLVAGVGLRRHGWTRG